MNGIPGLRYDFLWAVVFFHCFVLYCERASCLLLNVRIVSR